VKGKYTFVALDYSTSPTDDAADGEDGEGDDSKDEKKEKKSSKLDERVQSLVKLIYNKDMMESQMREMDFDVKKMPLGKLHPNQIKLGHGVLKKMADLVENGGSKSKLQELSDEFYSLIPHAGGMSRLPAINTAPLITKKLELLEA
jgi:poly [ADP-ribose] polymerase